MNGMIKSLLLGLLIVVSNSANALERAYSFSGLVDSGFYNGTMYSGDFSFDDASILSVGVETLSLSSLNFNFGSLAQYSLLTPALANASAVFNNGVFTGIEWSVDSTNPAIGFSFIVGDTSISEAYFAYDTSLGLSGAGTIIYTPVPEPEAAAMMFAGLGLLGWHARRKKQA